MTVRSPDWLFQRAMAQPREVALAFGSVHMTYATLNMRAANLAAHLAGRGVQQGDRVALIGLNSPEYVVAIHAVARLGAVLVPLNPRLVPAEMAAHLQQADVRLVVCDEATHDLAYEACNHAGVALPLVAPTEPEPALGDALTPYHGADDLHSIMFTSGTTGVAKGAMLTRGNFWNSAAASAYNLGVLPGDRWLACMPLFHVGGLSIILRCAIYGTTVVLQDRFDEARVNQALRHEGVTVASLVPTMLERLLDADDLPYSPTTRAVLIGGGPVREELLLRARGRGLPVVQTYGLTEAASQVTTLSPGDALERLGSAGKPLVSTSIRVDADPGQAGEILVQGPTVTPGYFRDPAATESVLRDGWLHTGDIGQVDDEGFLYVLDRRDDLIVTGGENVYPAEVEARLLEHPGVRDVAVIGVPDDRWGHRVVAVIVPEGAFDAPAMDGWLRPRLAAYKLPRDYRLVEQLPRTESGKLQRGRVRAWMLEQPDV